LVILTNGYIEDTNQPSPFWMEPLLKSCICNKKKSVLHFPKNKIKKSQKENLAHSTVCRFPSLLSLDMSLQASELNTSRVYSGLGLGKIWLECILGLGENGWVYFDFIGF